MKVIKAALLLFILTYGSRFNYLQSQTYFITDIAGMRRDGQSGDGGPATKAHLNNPIGIYQDPIGNIYIADWGNSKIRVVNPSGIINTFAGNNVFGYSGDGGPATAAELKGTIGIVSDTQGNVYVTDIGNERIRKVDKNGLISTFAGNGKYGYSGDGGPAIYATFADPTGICIDKMNRIYVSDAFNNRVRKINTDGIIYTIAGNGTRGYSGDGGPATAAEFYYPTGITLDFGGNLYIADQDNSCIRKVNTLGIISTVAGNGITGYAGDGGAATSAELNTPASIAVDKAGNLFIADGNNNRIRMVDTDGIITAIAGNGIGGYSASGGPALAAELYNPSSIVSGNDGILYFSNPFNDRIQEIRRVDSNGPAELQVSVYPNPNNGVFNFNVESSSGIIKVDIYDILGQKVLSTNLVPGINQISLQAVNKAIYIFRVSSSTNPTAVTGKIVVM
jgi:sugar lactone lactonase YvrE